MKRLYGWAILLLAHMALLPPAPASAAPPQTLHYQGYLTNSSGAPVNGTTPITFQLYTAASGGSPVWSETHASVNVANGNYQAILGNATPFNLPFDGQYWLGVTAGGDGEMAPRQALAMVPYAYRAVAADSLASGATVQGSQVTGQITGATLSGGTLTQLDGRYGVASEVQPPQANTLTPVDTAGSVGFYTSITIGADGLPVISHYDNSNSGLKVTKCGNAACSAGNTHTSVDTTANVGQYTSIAIGPDGLPVISYYDVTSLDLKVAKCGNAACSAGNTLTPVDTAGNVGRFTSIAIGADGLPVISYLDDSNGDLKVAKCGNAACSAGNTFTNVDPDVLVGYYTSITIGTDGLPVIAYADINFSDLKVAKCGNAACSASNTLTPVDTAGNVGQYTSIAIGADGLPVISHWGGGVGLKVAKCGNAACSAANTHTIVDADAGNQHTSITIGPDGLPVISYYDAASLGLKVAKCGNAACSAGNTLTRVDTAALFMGLYSSITIGADGLPVISYQAGTNLDLKVAKCANAFCAPYFRRR
mgnify:CR=1 FL=1